MGWLMDIILPFSIDKELATGKLLFNVTIFPLIRLNECIHKFNVLCININ
jgi:hypothetical protein